MPAPDFFCIGCQRAGTTTLYNVLEHHPDVWLPPIKELHYFDFPEYSFEKRLKTLARRKQRFLTRTPDATTREKEPASRSFFEAYDRIIKSGVFDLDGYRSLFAGKEGFVSGDVTPAFSVLPNARITVLAESFPDIKAVLLVRNPIDRLWSHANKSMRDHDSNVTRDISAFRAFCKNERVMMRSLPSQIHNRWKEQFGDRLRFFFFDDLRDQPAIFFRDICEFLDLDADRLQLPAPKFLNKESKRKKEERAPEFTRHLFQILEEELENCIDVFDGHAHFWMQEARRTAE